MTRFESTKTLNPGHVVGALLALCFGCDGAVAERSSDGAVVDSDGGATLGDAGRTGTGRTGTDAAGDDDAGADDVDGGPRRDAGSITPPGGTLAERYPGDMGMGADPAVVWFEDFEASTVAAVQARYDRAWDAGRQALVTNTPTGSGRALAMRADGAQSVDLFKSLPGDDEWYVRYYVHYERGVEWSHTGFWFGGYNPAMPWPNPYPGFRPDGDERFSFAIEPVWDRSTPARFDTYNYWRGMHSFMAPPVDESGYSYFGNTVVHRNDFTVDEESWVCLEMHLLLNPDPATAAGAVFEIWKNDALMRRFTDAGPLGWWARDKFCPGDTDHAECTRYPAPATEVLDLRVRTTTALQLNYIWPQNHISTGDVGTVIYDQIVVATERVGCIR